MTLLLWPLRSTSKSFSDFDFIIATWPKPKNEGRRNHAEKNKLAGPNTTYGYFLLIIRR